MKSWIRASAATLLLALVSGCGDKPTAPANGVLTQQSADDFAVQTATSLSVLGGDVQFALGSTPNTAQAFRRAAPASAAWDTSFTIDGISYQASRTFYDANDIELPEFGPDVVRMHWTAHAAGGYQSPRGAASLIHDAVLDVRGLEPAQTIVQLDGTCEDAIQSSFVSLDGTRTRYFYWTSTTAIVGVHMTKGGAVGSQWPLDGTVTYHVVADRLRSYDRADVEAHFEVTVVVTFNGTSEPEIVVNGTYRYHWNMETGVITRV